MSVKVFAVIPALVVLVSLCGSPVPLPPGTVTGTVFYDANRNGLHDSCDSPIQNAHVVVTGSNGKTASADTDATGAFEVKDAPAGDDQVTLLTGQDSIWPITTLAAGQTGETVHVTSSQTIAGIEIGSASRAAYIADTVSVSGVIFLDANGNGVVDKDECGLPSASATMEVAEGGRTAILQSDGTYEMMELPADATNSIQVDYSYTGATIGQQTPRQLAPTNGIGNTPCLRTVATTPRYGPTTFEANVGFKEPEAVGSATVNGTVFDDANGNGVRDEGEASVPNVSINLYGPAGDCGGAKASADVQSDANGNFLVASLPPGDYLGNLYTAALDSSTIVSWPNVSSRPFTIKEGSNQLEIPVQLIPAASVRVVAFDDTNHNGTQDGGEAPVSGASFCVVPGPASSAKPGFFDGVPVHVCPTTDADGVAVITPLAAGDYVVEFTGTADGLAGDRPAISVHLDPGLSVIVPFPLDITAPGSSTPVPAPSTPRQTPSPSFP